MDGLRTVHTGLGVVAGVGRHPHVSSDAWGELPAVDATGDVVVWEADGLVDGCVGYGHHVAARLAAAGLAASVVPLDQRMPTEHELNAPVHVLSGGSTSVDACVGWLDAVRGTLRAVLDRALAGDATVTGICFGAQLIAHILAGSSAVACHPDGMQAGLVDAFDPLDELDGRRVPVASLHYHRIEVEPVEAAGGRVLLSSTTTPVQAFEFGRRVRGVQFHPELGPDELTDALVANREVLERHGANVPEAVASVEAYRRCWSDEPWERYVLGPALAPFDHESSAVTAA